MTKWIVISAALASVSLLSGCKQTVVRHDHRPVVVVEGRDHHHYHENRRVIVERHRHDREPPVIPHDHHPTGQHHSRPRPPAAAPVPNGRFLGRKDPGHRPGRENRRDSGLGARDMTPRGERHSRTLDRDSKREERGLRRGEHRSDFRENRYGKEQNRDREKRNERDRESHGYLHRGIGRRENPKNGREDAKRASFRETERNRTPHPEDLNNAGHNDSKREPTRSRDVRHGPGRDYHRSSPSRTDATHPARFRETGRDSRQSRRHPEQSGTGGRTVRKAVHVRESGREDHRTGNRARGDNTGVRNSANREGNTNGREHGWKKKAALTGVTLRTGSATGSVLRGTVSEALPFPV